MKFRFDSFTLDTETRELLDRHDAIHLSPKAFELLKVLVESRPRALSKAELHEKLWRDTFVSDANLAILIKEIRRALQEDTRAPRFIRTVHGFGYAFSGAAAELTNSVGVRDVKPDVSYWLIWRTQKFALSEGRNLIGRSPEAAVWVDVPGISREHARITIHGDAVSLEDLGSTNGTFLSGQRLTAPLALRDRDEVRFGPAAMTFRCWTPGAGTKTQDLNEATSPAS